MSARAAAPKRIAIGGAGTGVGSPLDVLEEPDPPELDEELVELDELELLLVDELLEELVLEELDVEEELPPDDVDVLVLVPPNEVDEIITPLDPPPELPPNQPDEPTCPLEELLDPPITVC